jgi:hypothetical protein
MGAMFRTQVISGTTNNSMTSWRTRLFFSQLASTLRVVMIKAIDDTSCPVAACSALGSLHHSH